VSHPAVDTSGARRRAGRPQAGVLDRGRIAQAALEIATANGYSTLTMSAVAKSLGVSPSALYNHVDSKQELLQWIQEIVMAGVDHSLFATHPLDRALARWADSYRAVFADHAPLIPVIAVLPVSGSPRILAMYEAVTGGFVRAGWPPERIVPAIVALESFIFGSALDATAPLDIFDPGRHTGSLPAFEGALEAQRATGAARADSAFRAGLDAMIRGLLSSTTA
jgi:AcrR family transcriptional regulator